MNPIESAKHELNQTCGRMLELVEATPGDKLFWKPSPTARSIGEIVAHSAHAMGEILSQMHGNAFPILISAEANPVFLEHDRQFTDRAEVIAYFESKRDAYLEFLDTLTEDQLDRPTPMPFGLGEIPLRFFMTAGANHTNGHIAQIEYIQTIYADYDWHRGF